MVTKKKLASKQPAPKRSSRKPSSAAKTTPQKVVESTLVQDGPRKIRTPKRRPWRRIDKRFRTRPKLPSAWRISRLAGRLLAENWKVLGGIVLIYGLLTIILVRGLNGGTDVSQVKQQVDTLFHGTLGHLAAGFSVFALLLSSSNSAASDAAGAYQFFLVIFTSLAVVWVFRQRLGGVNVRIRDGFYNGMSPLIPVLLVLLVLALQLTPLLVTSWLYSTAISNGIAITGGEKFIWVLVLIAGALLSFYLICSSLFALYIATLPGMTPLKALRSARGLVRYRRFSVLRKLLFLPLVLMIFGSLVMLPFILFVPVLAQWVFFLLSMAALAAANAYIYILYRELLHE